MKLPLPGDTRWNSVSDALESYLKQWSILVDLDLETEIQSKIMNLGVKSNAKDLLERLKHVSKATDLLQSNDCYLSKAVTIWKNLNLPINLPKNLTIPHSVQRPQKKLNNRYSQAITEWHLIAFSLDPNNQVREKNIFLNDLICIFFKFSTFCKCLILTNLLPIYMVYLIQIHHFMIFVGYGFFETDRE